jgi:hypothetical protein
LNLGVRVRTKRCEEAERSHPERHHWRDGRPHLLELAGNEHQCTIATKTNDEINLSKSFPCYLAASPYPAYSFSLRCTSRVAAAAAAAAAAIVASTVV